MSKALWQHQLETEKMKQSGAEHDEHGKALWQRQLHEHEKKSHDPMYPHSQKNKGGKK